MVRRRLLLPAEPERAEGDIVLMCPADTEVQPAEVDDYGDHALRCRMAISTQRTIHWHDPVVRAVAGVARKAGLGRPGANLPRWSVNHREVGRAVALRPLLPPLGPTPRRQGPDQNAHAR